jgi:lysyl-tRNA synthetase class 2
MLEWYRSHAGLPDLAEDLAFLLPRCAAAAGLADARVRGCDLSIEPETMSFAEAFERHADGDGHGLPPAERERIFALEVEPHLGRNRPTLIVDWPADAAALARLRPDAGGRLVAARMELFVAGIELANGFDELNDPEEQRRRHEADRAQRSRLGASVPPLDVGFLGALQAGVPPAAGMALGMDRLIMLLAGAQEISDVRLFCR